MIPNVGTMEIVVVVIVAFVVFGPKRLPELGNSLGHGIRDFRSAVKSDASPAGSLAEGGTDVAPTPPAARASAQNTASPR